MSKIVYKLFRVRKDGTLGSLFLNAPARLKQGVWLRSKKHPKKGFKVRNGWHTLGVPRAPHLSNRGRAWYKVVIRDFETLKRPKCHGDKWYLAREMKILEKVRK